MQPTIDQPFKFKFQFSDPNGNATSVFSLKGSFDGETLRLDKETLVIAGLLNVVRRQNRMVLTGIRDEGEVVQFILILSSKGVAAQLKQAVDIARSAHWAKVHREQLAAAGRGSSYRDATCPHCTATIILSDLPVTPQLFCPFCEALTTVAAGAEPPPNEKEFRLCDECGMFSHPQKFTIFYFYFLLVVYGFWTNEKWCCRACMRKDAWKMLAGNFLFVLGVPVAITQLIRAYSGSYSGGAFRGLDGGNIKLTRGDITGALENYRKILERVPCSAGIKYNLGRGLIQQKELDSAAKTLEGALQDCGNYVPAYQHLRHVYEQLGRTQDLKRLDAMWTSAESQAEEADDDDEDELEFLDEAEGSPTRDRV